MDQKDYRRALSSFPTGVTIVTAFDLDRQPWGLTANSFTSVSLDPAVISVCVAKTGRVFPTLAASSRFAVNILSADQQDLALHFASDIENRFVVVKWDAAPEGAPLLPGVAAQLDCALTSTKAYCEYRRTAKHKDGTSEEYLSVDILTFDNGLIVH